MDFSTTRLPNLVYLVLFIAIAYSVFEYKQCASKSYNNFFISNEQDLISAANMTFPAVVVYKTKYSYSVSGRVAVAVAPVNISRLLLKLDGVALSI